MWCRGGTGAVEELRALSQAQRFCGCAQELQLRWQQYYELVTVLVQWVRQHTVLFEERRFPASYEEIEVSGAAARGEKRPRPGEL